MAGEQLHIACGASAAGGMKVGLRGRATAVLVHDDNFSCGPLGPLQSPEQWRKMRAAFWARLLARPTEEESPSGDPWTVLGGLDRLVAADQVTLWLGAGLPDQLFSIWFVQLAHLVRFDLARVRLVDVLARGPHGLLSVGDMKPAWIAAHPPGQPLEPAAIQEMEAAWSAVTAPDPGALLALLAAGLPARPQLHQALLSLPGRFPDERTGLSLHDEVLLSHVRSSGPRMNRVLGDVMAGAAAGADKPDLYCLLGRLYRMAAPRSRFPLLTVAPLAAPQHPYEIRVAPDGAEIIDPPADGEVRITPVGEDVLAGRQNMVALNGIDDWVCGIHLDSAAGRVWYRSETGSGLRPGAQAIEP